MPNNILFVEKLKSDVVEDVLVELFKQYPGFREVRLIPGKNIAFVEYDNHVQAGTALAGNSLSSYQSF